MDREIEDKMVSTINRYLFEVTESNPSALPEILFRASMFRIMLMLFGRFMSDFDDSLKHLEDELRTILKKEDPNDR